MIKEKTDVEKYYQNIDKEVEMIPLTFDPIFKGIFETNLELLKKFIVSVLDLGLNPDDCKITLLNNEIPKENKKEYGKTVDVYILLNETIYIELEINRYCFEKVKLRNYLYANKLYSMILESGNDIRALQDKCFYQLNLNVQDKMTPFGEDIIVPYGLNSKKLYINNYCTVLKYLEFYRELYYTKGVNLSESEIWLASLTAKNFTELNEMLSRILSLQAKDKDKLIGEAIRMSKDYFSIHEWEKEKCDELVRLESKRIDREEGFEEGYQEGIEEGIEQGIEHQTKEMILSMLEHGANLDLIAKVANKSVEEINEIKNSKI